MRKKAPARRRLPPIKAPVGTVVEELAVEEEDLDVEDVADVVTVSGAVPVAPAPAAPARRPAAGGRRKGRGGATTDTAE